VYEIHVSREPMNGFAPNSHGRRAWFLAQVSLKVNVKGQRSKVKVSRDNNGIFRPFRRPACGLCLVKHISPLIVVVVVVVVVTMIRRYALFQHFEVAVLSQNNQSPITVLTFIRFIAASFASSADAAGGHNDAATVQWKVREA